MRASIGPWLGRRVKVFTSLVSGCTRRWGWWVVLGLEGFGMLG